jgi:hypothetical protein
MERVLEWMPPPHFSVQVEAPDQPETLQSMGQAWTLQVRCWVSGAHKAPPWAVLVTTDLERNIVPVAQDWEHVLKADQVDCLQSTGQAWRLQVRVWRSAVHAAPPWATNVTTDLVRNIVPVPHDLEQLLKVDQPESLQSMGHANLLQEVMAERVGQSLPPCSWSVEMVRVLVEVPSVPQVAEQADQAV